MIGIDAVPERLDSRMTFADNHDTQIPIRQALAKEPACRASADLHCLRERFTGSARLFGGRPTETVNPFFGGIGSEPAQQFLMKAAGARSRLHARIVRAPVRYSPDVRRLRKIAIRQIKDDASCC